MFAALSENLRVSSQQGQTLESIVREMMRPMLKQWLDENLPSIVEEKVQLKSSVLHAGAVNRVWTYDDQTGAAGRRPFLFQPPVS
jgi:hypothetical protein